MVNQFADGVRLLRELTGHGSPIGRIGWSPDGRLLATPSSDRTICIRDADSGACLRTIRGHRGTVLAAAFDPDGRILATGGDDGTKLWNVDSGKLRTTLDTGSGRAAAFSPDNRILATAGDEVTLWELSTGTLPHQLTGHNTLNQITGYDHSAISVAFDAEGGMLATGGTDHTIVLWEVPAGRQLRILAGHSENVNTVVFHPVSRILASASDDRTIRLWDVTTGSTISVLEGHTGAVPHLSVSRDGRMLVSNSLDCTVRLWEIESGRCRGVLPALASVSWTPSVAFHPQLPILAAVLDAESSTPEDSVVQLWELDVDRLLEHAATPSISYTTAKIVLVGESGVGKTGLGWRLAHGEFVEHSSTHGQRFWLLDELRATEEEGTERDAILWDLAGQPDYRLVHALYLDDADLALVLFDPTRDDDPLRGVE
jgi:hypothetical protein